MWRALYVRVIEPSQYWTTIERPQVTYRIYPSYERWVGWWDTVIQNTLAPIPTGDRPSLLVEQRHSPYLSQIEEEFGYSTPEGQAITQRGNELSVSTESEGRDNDPWPIRVGDTLYRPQADPLAIAVAQRAVGLPLLAVTAEGRLYTDEEIASFGQSSVVVVEEGGGEEIIETDDGPYWPGKEFGDPQPVAGDRIPLELACTAEGQAREVVAAWLAARGSPDLASLYQRIHADGPNAAGLGRYTNVIADYGPNDEAPIRAVNWRALGWMQIGGYGGGSGARAVQGSPTAVDLAAQLLERPDEEVATLIAANWDEWTNPATTIQALIDVFGLDSPPNPTEWIERAGLDPAEFAASIAAYPHTPGDLDSPTNPTRPANDHSEDNHA